MVIPDNLVEKSFEALASGGYEKNDSTVHFHGSWRVLGGYEKMVRGNHPSPLR